MLFLNMHKVLDRAKSSRYYLWLLNIGMNRVIPFNKPHGIKIVEISNDSLHTVLPYKKSNFNHINSLHACSMATIAEFTTGFLMVSKVNAKKYRLIMNKLSMEYFYQGKMDAHVRFTIDDSWFKEFISNPLEKDGVAEVVCEVEVKDIDDNVLAIGQIGWHIKSWEMVKTRT